MKHKENGDTLHSEFEDVLTKISFFHNASSLPDLTSLIPGYDPGHVFRDFVSKMANCGERIYSTLKHFP